MFTWLISLACIELLVSFFLRKTLCEAVVFNYWAGRNLIEGLADFIMNRCLLAHNNKTKCESSFSFHLWHFIRSIILILIEASVRLDGEAWILWSLRTGVGSQFCLSLVIWGSFKCLSFGCALLNLGCDENM